MLGLACAFTAFALPTPRLARLTLGVAAEAHRHAPPGMGLSRRDALVLAGAASWATAFQAAQAAEITTKAGVAIPYTVLKSAPAGGGSPKVGDLVAIRFKGAVKATGAVFDDILESPEPYYMRLGSLKVLPAVEEVLPYMKSGDKWQLTIPGSLGFGDKGRSASPGKPRIPANAELDFTLELVAVPGRDEEIIEAGLGD
ncbi:hypothetical protein AB1Y20_003195 [Prymnesium parvum]|uniref:peptidylprolyl isomerase n=1 Tax=Prymnesium parvum TaxID=97485 RepID=A0AB34JCY8_PRYPA